MRVCGGTNNEKATVIELLGADNFAGVVAMVMDGYLGLHTVGLTYEDLNVEKYMHGGG